MIYLERDQHRGKGLVGTYATVAAGTVAMLH